MKQKIQIFLSLLLIISPLYIKADTPNVSVKEPVSENQETFHTEEQDSLQEEEEDNHHRDDQETLENDMDTEKQEVEDSLEKGEDEEKIQDSNNTTEEAIIDEENLEEKDFSETPPISDEEVTQDFIQPAFGTTQIRHVSELRSAHTRLDYSGRIRADGEYQELTSHIRPLQDRDEMHQQNFGIAHKKPLLVHYENEQFSMEGQFILRENLYNKKYVFPSMNYY